MALRRLAALMQHTPLSSFRCAPCALHSDCSSLGARLFGAGAYLDKNAVAERVMQCVSHFDKVDKAQARGQGSAARHTPRRGALRRSRG